MAVLWAGQSVVRSVAQRVALKVGSLVGQSVEMKGNDLAAQMACSKVAVKAVC